MGGGSDEHITQMLEAHYNGWLNIEDYWSVGDCRTVNITGFSLYYTQNDHNINYFNDVSEQNVELCIIGLNHDNLKQPIRSCTKSAVTVQLKECLVDSLDNSDSSSGVSSVSSTDGIYYSKYGFMRDKWFYQFIDALPEYIRNNVKIVTKYNLDRQLSNDNIDNGFGKGIIKYNTKAFFLSLKEIFGSNPPELLYSSNNNVYTSTTNKFLVECSLDENILSQYEYMKTPNNIIKHDKVYPIPKTCNWWTRSSCGDDAELYIDPNGNPKYDYGIRINSDDKPVVTACAAPAFCL